MDLRTNFLIRTLATYNTFIVGIPSVHQRRNDFTRGTILPVEFLEKYACHPRSWTAKRLCGIQVISKHVKKNVGGWIRLDFGVVSIDVVNSREKVYDSPYCALVIGLHGHACVPIHRHWKEASAHEGAAISNKVSRNNPHRCYRYHICM